MPALPKPLPRIDLLDYGRFAAAIAVMAYHLFCLLIAAGKAPNITLVDSVSAVASHGYLGVELFFMISGYVIFFSAQGRTPAQFAVSRMLRLYPAFLFCMLATAAVKLAFPVEAGALYPSQFLTNLTMMPRLFGRNEIDGSYWTLTLELCFYAMVMVMLVLRQSKNLEKMFICWPVVILVAGPLGSTSMPVLGGYYSYFAAGALFAIRKTNRSHWVSLALLICFYDSMRAYNGNKSPAEVSALINITAITCFYFFIYPLHHPHIANLRLPGAKFVGSLTYPVYLIHQVIGTVIIAKFATEANKVGVIFLVMVGMLAVAGGIHYLVEVRMKEWWRSSINRLVGVPVARMDIAAQSTRKLLMSWWRVKADQA